MIVATLPVLFSPRVLLPVQLRDLFINFGDLFLQTIQFLLRFSLLLVHNFKLLPNLFHLALKTVFFLTNFGQLGTDLFLLVFEFLDLRLNFLKFLDVLNRVLQLFNFLNHLALLI